MYVKILGISNNYKIVYVKMKDTAIKMYKMKKYFIHNHKKKYACELREMYENIQIALLKKV